MLRILTTIMVFVVLLAGSAAANPKPFVRVRWNGEAMRITYKGATMTYHFQPGHGLWAPRGYAELGMEVITRITTDYLEEKNGMVYMVSDIQGNSRGEEALGMGYCGAGEEKGKGSFVFNEKGEVRPPVFVVYESCFSSIEHELSNDEPPALVPVGKLLTEFECFRQVGPRDVGAPLSNQAAQKPDTTQLVTVRVYFDSDHPESGLKPVETCILFEPWIKSHRRIACPK